MSESSSRVYVGLRAVEHVVDEPALDDSSVAHHDDLLRDRPDQREVVRDEEQAEPELALELGEQVDDRRLDGDVERRRDLVADQELRLGTSARAMATRWRSPPESWCG